MVNNEILNMKDFDEILRKKLQESNFEPPQNLWQNIEEKLPKKKNEVVIVPFFFSEVFNCCIYLIFAWNGYNISAFKF